MTQGISPAIFLTFLNTSQDSFVMDSCSEIRQAFSDLVTLPQKRTKWLLCSMEHWLVNHLKAWAHLKGFLYICFSYIISRIYTCGLCITSGWGLLQWFSQLSNLYKVLPGLWSWRSYYSKLYEGSRWLKFTYWSEYFVYKGKWGKCRVDWIGAHCVFSNVAGWSGSEACATQQDLLLSKHEI